MCCNDISEFFRELSPPNIPAIHYMFNTECRSFCESYDMQEHSSRIFGDIVDALGSCIQSSFAAQSTASSVQLPFGITSSSSSSTVTNNSNMGGHVTPSGSMAVGGSRQLHLFNIRGTNIQVEVLPKNAHIKPM